MWTIVEESMCHCHCTPYMCYTYNNGAKPNVKFQKFQRKVDVFASSFSLPLSHFPIWSFFVLKQNSSRSFCFDFFGLCFLFRSEEEKKSRPDEHKQLSACSRIWFSTRFGYYFSHTNSDYQFNIVYFRISVCLASLQRIRCREPLYISHTVWITFTQSRERIKFKLRISTAHWRRLYVSLQRDESLHVHTFPVAIVFVLFCFIMYCMGSSHLAAVYNSISLPSLPLSPLLLLIVFRVVFP